MTNGIKAAAAISVPTKTRRMTMFRLRIPSRGSRGGMSHDGPFLRFNAKRQGGQTVSDQVDEEDLHRDQRPRQARQDG